MFDENSIWPVHLNPLKDEIASSWMMRNAIANGSPSFWSFAKHTVGHHGMWSRDMDVHILDKYLEKLSDRFQKPKEVIFKTTLLSYADKLRMGGISDSQIPWVMPLGTNVQRQHYGMQCCPQCLKEDEESYYRAYWRLAFMTVCPVHGKYLIDRCPNCESPILHKNIKLPKERWSFEPNDLTLCHHCSFNLKVVSQKPSSEAETQLNQELLHLAQRGQGDVLGTPYPSANIFFTALHRKLSWLICDSRGRKQYWKTMSELDINNPTNVESIAPNTELEHLDLTIRKKLIEILPKL